MRAPLAMLALAGCTQATIALPDGTSVQFSRVMTDAAISVSPDRLEYNSSPSAAAQQNITDALVRALAATVLPARLHSPPMPVTP